MFTILIIYHFSETVNSLLKIYLKLFKSSKTISDKSLPLKQLQLRENQTKKKKGRN